MYAFIENLEVIMKRICKSKIGFSLLEIIIVVAIIAILAGVMVMSIGTYINNAKAKSDVAEQSRRSAVTNILSSEARMNELGFGNSTNARYVTQSMSTSV
ncbi:MAG: prepilin-type N-terminal cleavage/methylation domain-containing protein [Clostridiales bacterium]|nr:prepilin-type N-terminal cleavage/methylation domain-containing protein [Clostridiales bacterium]